MKRTGRTEDREQREVESPLQACLTRDGQFLPRGNAFSRRANLRGSRISRDYLLRPPLIRQFWVREYSRAERSTAEQKIDHLSDVSLTSNVSRSDTIGTRYTSRILSPFRNRSSVRPETRARGGPSVRLFRRATRGRDHPGTEGPIRAFMSRRRNHK